jgi:hypothetical protein
MCPGLLGNGLGNGVRSDGFTADWTVHLSAPRAVC